MHASTKFFHANATIKFRRNLVTYLENDNGHGIYDHEGKAEMIWSAFKDRLGVSSFTFINFDLPSLLTTTIDCSSLVLPFSTQKIDKVVRSLPSKKAPGPDGFNIDFVKKCWPVICQDFYNLCNGFYNGSICL